jgi:hypothetical protein
MVGYDDTTNPLSHFKQIKNSWGTKWGAENGYFLVHQSSKRRYGLFGILAEGAIVNAQNVTGEVCDTHEQNFPLPNWPIILMALAGLWGCFCLLFAF